MRVSQPHFGYDCVGNQLFSPLRHAIGVRIIGHLAHCLFQRPLAASQAPQRPASIRRRRVAVGVTGAESRRDAGAHDWLRKEWSFWAQKATPDYGRAFDLIRIHLNRSAHGLRLEYFTTDAHIANIVMAFGISTSFEASSITTIRAVLSAPAFFKSIIFPKPI